MLEGKPLWTKDQLVTELELVRLDATDLHGRHACILYTLRINKYDRTRQKGAGLKGRT